MSQLPVLSWLATMDTRLEAILLVLCLSMNSYLIVCYFKDREAWFDLFFKILGSNYFCSFIFHRIDIQITSYFKNPASYSIWSWINWVSVMIMFLIFMAAYLTRSNPVYRANRAREIVYPICCGLLPFLVYESVSLFRYPVFRESELLVTLFRPFMELRPGHWSLTSIVLIIGGHLFSVWALYHLRRSFGILTEVRHLVTSGPYRYMRHPLYVGESLALVGFCFYMPSWFNIGITLVFLLCQRLRAHFEEQKFLISMPAYEDYRKTSGAYFPRVKSGAPLAAGQLPPAAPFH